MGHDRAVYEDLVLDEDMSATTIADELSHLDFTEGRQRRLKIDRGVRDYLVSALARPAKAIMTTRSAARHTVRSLNDILPPPGRDAA
jgi:hypothetical protein